MTTLYIKNGVLMTEHGECASAAADAILALVAPQSALLDEARALLPLLIDTADHAVGVADSMRERLDNMGAARLLLSKLGG